MNLFQAALRKQNNDRPPVWLMRQAGRYHAHYQDLRRTHSFLDLCKKPEVACEATMGPIRDFDFDAAILFSDLLFPLEVMGMGLTYDEGPKLDWHLRTSSDLPLLQGGRARAESLSFQARALELIRRELPPEKGLLGFVGGPLTLYCYAVEGSHAGELRAARDGLQSGLYAGFFDQLGELLAENMALQARAGADTVAMLDTCAGEFSPTEYREKVVPTIRQVLTEFKRLCPETPVVYYSKGTGPEHWEGLSDLPMDGIGVDWHHDLADVLTRFGDRWTIQGNIDPQWLFLEPYELESRLRTAWGAVRALPASARRGWICGLGHGVLPKTPEANVRLFVRLQREIFG